MVRIVIDIEEAGNKLATKESVAMDLEKYGRVRIVAIYNGKEDSNKPR